MRIESLYEEFLTYLAVERDCSPLTVAAYRSDAVTLKKALGDLGIAHEIQAIDRQVIRRYVVWMKDRGMSAATIGRKINSLRSFWNYLLDNDLAEYCPCPQ
jgi:integrase/recombinase XerC